MDTQGPWTVQAQALTDEAFVPYGEIIKPWFNGEQFDRSHLSAPEKAERPVKLVMTYGVPVLRIMHQKRRGLVFSRMARHLRVSQCLGALQGKDWFMAVAAPAPGEPAPGKPALSGPAPGKAAVDPADIAAFRIPGDRIIKLHVGTWHAGPHFTHDECLFLNLENEDTNTKDFEDAVLPHLCTIKA